MTAIAAGRWHTVREAVAKPQEICDFARREMPVSSVTKTLLLVCVAFLLAIGQLLLKNGVQTASAGSGKPTLPSLALSLAVTWQFWAAMMVCGFVVLLWAWILTFIPLSKAYPFVVLAFVFTAIFESVFFGVQMLPKFFIGCSLILAGLMVIIA
jgi:hypothetical protein